MRRRFEITLTAACMSAMTWAPYNSRAIAEPIARFSSAIEIPKEADWVGGISGLSLSENGRTFYLITDHGTLAKGTIERRNGALDSLKFVETKPISNRFGGPHKRRFADAEGLAVDAGGRIFISFETENRVSVYESFQSPERLTSFTREWRVFPENQGLEALALAPDGALWTIPEFVWENGSEARIYRLIQGGEWKLHTTIPTRNGLRPVGADFGPDGHLYLLERGFLAFGFYSQVRRLTVNDSKIIKIETVLQTLSGRHGNLEGISVWKDAAGRILITMVSDDNFQSIQRNELVEYVLDAGVAQGTD